MSSPTSAVPPSVLDSMKCPICLDYATQAVETQCCEQIYCETCIQPLVEKECPSCREPNLRTRVSKIIRRMIGDLPAECPNKCGEKVTRYGLINHQEKCPQREYQCPLKDCEVIGIKTELIRHTVEAHSEDAFAALQALAVKSDVNDTSVQTEHEEKVYYCPFDALCPNGMGSRALSQHITTYHKYHTEDQWFNKVFHSDQGPIKITNSEKRLSQMAQNGKFYCGLEMGSFKKYEKKWKRIPCSIDSGLNCRSCMKLDVTLRNLPYGAMVNGAGCVSTPNFCTHPIKDSEYFGTNSRPALCSLITCGMTRQFSCDKMYRRKACTPNEGKTCTPNGDKCSDCQALTYVYGLRSTNGQGQTIDTDYDYYKNVWKKKFGGSPIYWFQVFQ